MNTVTDSTTKRKLLLQGIAQLLHDSQSVRKGCVELAAEEAAKPEPDQAVLHSLAQVEEGLRYAVIKIGSHPLALVYGIDKHGGKD